MPARELDRLVDSAARAARADRVPANARLREEVCISDVDVAGPLLPDLSLLGHRQLRVRRAAALPVAAIVHGDDVEALPGQVRSERVPRRLVAVALMKKEDSGSGTLARGIVGRGELGPIRSLQVNGATGDRFRSRGRR